jgi:hypothetical protein
MKTDTEIRVEGMAALVARLGLAEATRFVSLIQREGFDYTQWRQNLFEGMTVDQIADLGRQNGQSGSLQSPKNS